MVKHFPDNSPYADNAHPRLQAELHGACDFTMTFARSENAYLAASIPKTEVTTDTD
jgi:hypothetical protein